MSSGDQRPLHLRTLRLDDEDAARAGHAAMAAEGFVFCLALGPSTPWADYVAMLDANRRGEALPEGFVPSTFLVADVGGAIVGRTSIRHELDDFLEREGGHIGYAVLPAHRRRGYATEILRQSLGVAREHGIDDVLVCCDDDNVASAAVIERCGGVLDSMVESQRTGKLMRRYRIRGRRLHRTPSELGA